MLYTLTCIIPVLSNENRDIKSIGTFQSSQWTILTKEKKKIRVLKKKEGRNSSKVWKC